MGMEPLETDESGFDDLEDVFNGGEGSEEEIFDTEEPKEEKPKKRGRPPKKVEESENDSTKKDESKSKKVHAEDLDPEIINLVFENYSKIPLKDLAEKTKLKDRQIKNLINKLEEMFTLGIASGDLDQESYDRHIKSKLIPYKPGGSCEDFVKSKIKSLKKKK